MFLLICPKCRHRQPTSEFLCLDCGDDLSSIQAAEIMEGELELSPLQNSSSAAMNQEAPMPTRAVTEPEESASNSQAEPHSAGASEPTPPSTQGIARPVRECKCGEKALPRILGGELRCLKCDYPIRNQATSNLTENEPVACVSPISQPIPERLAFPERPSVQGVTVTLPWGERIKFDGLLVVGRAAHPDSRIRSLPENVRAKLQSEYATVSRFHLLLTTQGGDVIAETLGALNGAFVEGVPMASGNPVTLRFPCRLGLGGNCELLVEQATGST